MSRDKHQKRVLLLKDALPSQVITDETDDVTNTSELAKSARSTSRSYKTFKDSTLSSLCDVSVSACKSESDKVKFEGQLLISSKF